MPTFRELIDLANRLFENGVQPVPEEAQQLKEAIRRLLGDAESTTTQTGADKLDEDFMLGESALSGGMVRPPGRTPHSPAYVTEKLTAAVRTMATSAEPIQERLRNAYLHLLPLDEMDFPDAELRSHFTEISWQLTAKRDQQQGAIAATISPMRDGMASEIAAMLYSLFLGMGRLDRD